MASRPDKTKPGELMVCRNPKATQRYVIDEHLEAGMQLTGSEVKSLRDKKADLEGAYARIDNGELYVHKMYIGPYQQATSFAHEPKRSRKLLAHRSEIERWTGKLAVRGYTLVPVQVYFKNGRAKIELGLAKAKDMEDKREDIKRKVELREAKDAMGKGRSRARR
ncbi:MAG: tmRNA-binding protein SmpB [Myxococcaceae bacterium]|nr:tmRNA-binding protein SmpB [Myxococcaceae bacterium]